MVLVDLWEVCVLVVSCCEGSSIRFRNAVLNEVRCGSLVGKGQTWVSGSVQGELTLPVRPD